MKLNFKRIISFVDAAAMALSSFSMLTVSAENEETVISPIVQTASVAAQVRASGVNENELNAIAAAATNDIILLKL